MTTLQFKDKLFLKNPNIEVLGEYINSKLNIKVKCKICGYEWEDSSCHLYSRPCRNCKNKEKQLNLHFNFIQKAKEIHEDKYDYSKVEDYKYDNEIIIICPIHGEFKQKASSHLKGHGCPKCSHRSYKYTNEEWILKANQIHNNKYDYSKVKYINKESEVTIICPIHGEFLLRAGSHIRGIGCEKCGIDSRVIKRSSNTEEFIQKAKQIHGDKYNYNKVNYINSHTEVCIICSKHGEFWQEPCGHLSGYGCPKCKLKSQTKLFNKLQELFPNEEIIFEVGNKDIPWIGNQRIDIYFPKYNIAIEYNGILHYIPIEYFGGELGFQDTIKRDELKRQKCKENNCTLFEVKYNYTNDDFNNLVNYIKDIMQD